ncbi:MAG: GNAT family N-acetyltransferase, partial [Sphaerochaetaceae bacterium]
FQEQCNNYWETRLLVPKNENWEQLIRETYGDRVREIIRYAMKKEPYFDTAALTLAISSLSPTYLLREIDEILYHYLKTENWSKDLVGQFPNYERFRDLGLGFVILKDNEIVSGASSFCRYHNGIEIQVDTKEAFRRRGLAFVCSAKLILTCLQRNLSPSWDAQTEISLHLAQKLGYVLDYPYQSFELRHERLDTNLQ